MTSEWLLNMNIKVLYHPQKTFIHPKNKFLANLLFTRLAAWNSLPDHLH